MTRDERLEGVADVLLIKAEKVRELSDTGAKDGYVSRETALALQIVGIAHELKALARDRAEGKPA